MSNITVSFTEVRWPTPKGLTGKGSKDFESSPANKREAETTVKLSFPPFVIAILIIASRVQDFSPHDRSFRDPNCSFNRSGPDTWIKLLCNGSPVMSLILQRII